MTSTRLVALAGISAALVLVPSAAAGTIVPGVSIAGVKLGDSAAAVRSRLGAPANIQKGPPGSGVVRYDYPTHNRMAVVITNGRATSVSVTALPGERVYDRTSRGLGLLSPMSALSKAYPASCFKYGPAPPGCTFDRGRTWMRMSVSGRYGMGWKAPLESIELSYR